MKKVILYISTILLTSCHMTSYVSDLESTPYGIDFREGKWLLNEIESPERVKPILTRIAYKGFYKNLGDNLKKVEELKNVKLSFISTQPNVIQLERIKRQSKFDYLIIIKCENSESAINTVIIGAPDGKKINRADAILEVYDLNSFDMIYYQKITGEVEVNDKDDSGFSFVKGTNGIMIRSLEKIMKKIK